MNCSGRVCVRVRVCVCMCVCARAITGHYTFPIHIHVLWETLFKYQIWSILWPGYSSIEIHVGSRGGLACFEVSKKRKRKQLGHAE